LFAFRFRFLRRENKNSAEHSAVKSAVIGITLNRTMSALASDKIVIGITHSSAERNSSIFPIS